MAHVNVYLFLHFRLTIFPISYVQVRMLADPRAEFASALDITFDATGVLGQPRCRRFSAVVEDGVFKTLNLEESGGMTCSLANQIMDQLKQ